MVELLENPRSPVLEQIGVLFDSLYLPFSAFGSKLMLSGALIRTVSTQFKSVDAQRCGHRAKCPELKARKLNIIYPVSSLSDVSILYFRKLVCYSSG